MRGGTDKWAQLITMRVKPGEDMAATAQALRDAEQL
jgi:hypothetical protein